MIIFNVVGLGMLFSGFLVGCLVGATALFVFRDATVAATSGSVCGILVVVGCDLRYRATNRRELGPMRFLWPTAGGMLWFIPLWIYMGVVPLCRLAIVTSRRPTRITPAMLRAAPTEAEYRARVKR